MNTQDQLVLGLSEEMIQAWIDKLGLSGSVSGLHFAATTLFDKSLDQTRQGILSPSKDGYTLTISALNVWAFKDLESIAIHAAAVHLARRGILEQGKAEEYLKAWVESKFPDFDNGSNKIQYLVKQGYIHGANAAPDVSLYLDVPKESVDSFVKTFSKNAVVAQEAGLPVDIAIKDKKDKPVTPVSKPTVSKIENDKIDIGEYVPGARKDHFILSELLTEITSDEDAKKATGVITRDKLWEKPNHNENTKKHGAETAYLISALHQTLKPQPVFRSKTDVERFVETVEKVQNMAETGGITSGNFRERTDTLVKQLNFVDSKGMLTSLGREHVKANNSKLTDYARRSWAYNKLIRKMSSEIKEGWPNKKSPWLIGFDIVKEDKGFYVRPESDPTKALKGSPFESFEEAELALQERHYKNKLEISKDPLDYQSYAINRILANGDARYLKGGFDSMESAQDYLNEYVLELSEQPPLKIIRHGLRSVWREGKPLQDDGLTLADFKEKFGFKAIQFGKSLKDDERNEHIKYANAAFSDLAGVLGLEPRAMSLNGSLSLAFGARGKGTSMAHYEPGLKIINLTRVNGAGSLSHEWFHALDNHLATYKLAGTTIKSGYLSKPIVSNPNLPAKISTEFQRLMVQLKERIASAKQYKDYVQQEYDIKARKLTNMPKWVISSMSNKIEAKEEGFEIYQHMLKDLELFVKNIERGEVSESDVAIKGNVKSIAALKHVQDNLDKVVNPGIKRNLEGFINNSGALYLEVVDLQNELKTPSEEKRKNLKVETMFFKAAKVLDAGSPKVYWSASHEIAARAFERYVSDQLEDNGEFNHYLVNGVGSGVSSTLIYPPADEADHFKKVFSDVMQVVAHEVNAGELELNYKGDVNVSMVDTKEEIKKQLYRPKV